ncbi:ATPase [Erythrobacter sp. W53]|uniref:ATPase n=1 Tax=Erythrobacter sp. W53 TaxID=3425947 RepID=UPI003D769842
MSTGTHIRAVGDDEGLSSDQLESHTDAEDVSAEDLLLTDEIVDRSTEYWEEDEPVERSFSWIIPSLGILTVLVWTGFFAWVKGPQVLAGGSPQQWLIWIKDWSLPVLLVMVVWLLVMRSSSREAARFGDAARSLSQESALLEQRLTTVNRELSLAREFLGSQSRDLEFLGRSASERISEHAEQLQSLITVNGTQIEAISGASTVATENMTKLRDDLPVIANSARDVSNQIGNAGRTAKTQLKDLATGFERLNEFGQASERQVETLSEKVGATLADLEERLSQVEAASEERFTKMRDESEEFRTELDGREVLALAAMRGRAEALRKELAEVDDAQEKAREETAETLRQSVFMLREEAEKTSAHVREGEKAATEAWTGQLSEMQERLLSVIAKVSEIDAKALDASRAKLRGIASEAETLDTRIAERSGVFFAQIAKRRADAETEQQEALARVEALLDAFDSKQQERQSAQQEVLSLLSDNSDAVESKVADTAEKINAIVSKTAEAEASLSASATAFAQTFDQSEATLSSAKEAIEELTDASVRMLELIQASAKHSKDDLPSAIHGFEASLENAAGRTDTLRQQIEQAREAGDALSKTVEDATDAGAISVAGIEELIEGIKGTLGEQAEAVDTLHAKLGEFGSDADATAARTQGELRHAIRELEESSKSAIAALETEQAESVRKIAAEISKKTESAIRDAVVTSATIAMTDLDASSERATTASREAALELRNQLTKVNDLVANIESRVAHARERAEEQVDNDFSRRVALITESLNSNAIDIGKALSTEVTDTAWTSYLRGDRGIFTRRAVHLIDSTEAREIAELYDADSEFREHVSRYIHDFEAMLRTLLSTRDGNAVSVTLLGSDMGKLYVALAQSLERLRQ